MLPQRSELTEGIAPHPSRLYKKRPNPMDATKLQIKLYADNLAESDIEQFVVVFHRWIRESVLDELMIDVADYTHVPEGPGILFVGHGSDYFVEVGPENRPGLLYSRKRALPEGAKIVEDSLRRALNAAKLLSQEGPKPSFGTSEILIRIPDRLHVTNDDAAFDAVKGEVAAALSEVFDGKQFELVREGDAREPLTIRARAA